MHYLFILLGGFLGSISRYLIGEWIILENGFPIGTFTVNLIGCLFLSWFLTFILHQTDFPSHLKAGISTGFAGSFTTFSTFSVETLQLIQNGKIFITLLYVFSSILLGIILAWIGYTLAMIMTKNKETDVK